MILLVSSACLRRRHKTLNLPHHSKNIQHFQMGLGTNVLTFQALFIDTFFYFFRWLQVNIPVYYEKIYNFVEPYVVKLVDFAYNIEEYTRDHRHAIVDKVFKNKCLLNIKKH